MTPRDLRDAKIRRNQQHGKITPSLSRTVLVPLLLLMFLTGNLHAQEDQSNDETRIKKPEVVKDGIVAHVNDEVIMASEVMERIQPRLRLQARQLNRKQFRKKRKEIFRKELANMVEEKVVFQAAKEENVNVQEGEIQDAMDRMIDRFGSREKFMKALKQHGMTLEDWKRRRKKEKLQVKLFRRKFQGAGMDNFVSPREIREYYRENKHEFYREPRVKGAMISIPYGTSPSRKTARIQAEEILKQVQNGAVFSSLVKVYKQIETDDTQVFDWTKKGTFHRDIEKMLFQDMKVNEVAGPLDVDNRFVLIKLEGRIQGKQRSITNSDVQQKIRNRIWASKSNTNRQEIRKKLIQEAYIQPKYLKQVILDQ